MAGHYYTPQSTVLLKRHYGSFIKTKTGIENDKFVLYNASIDAGLDPGADVVRPIH